MPYATLIFEEHNGYYAKFTSQENFDGAKADFPLDHQNNYDRAVTFREFDDHYVIDFEEAGVGLDSGLTFDRLAGISELSDGEEKVKARCLSLLLEDRVVKNTIKLRYDSQEASWERFI